MQLYSSMVITALSSQRGAWAGEAGLSGSAPPGTWWQWCGHSWRSMHQGKRQPQPQGRQPTAERLSCPAVPWCPFLPQPLLDPRRPPSWPFCIHSGTDVADRAHGQGGPEPPQRKGRKPGWARELRITQAAPNWLFHYGDFCLSSILKVAFWESC